MTLILSCGTPDFVFQVSDRRLTYVDGPNAGTPSTEEANKAVVVGHRIAFGYTGPARIGTQRSDEWLAQVAADGPSRDLKAVCDRICERATDACKLYGIQDRRFAFVGIGWTSTTSDPGVLRPTLCTISNAVGPDGEWLKSAAPAFMLQVNNWGRAGAGFCIAATGRPLKREERYAVCASLDDS